MLEGKTLSQNISKLTKFNSLNLNLFIFILCAFVLPSCMSIRTLDFCELPCVLGIKQKGIAKGILTQTLGPWKKPVAYLSRKLDPWPQAGPLACIIAAVAMLVKNADKLTLGQNLVITPPHALQGYSRLTNG